MQDVVCAVCGRRTALAPGAAITCPSCSAPLSAPMAAPISDSAAAFDDSATRPSIPPIPPLSDDSLVPPASPIAPAAPSAQPEAQLQPLAIADEPESVTAPVGLAVAGAGGDMDDARTMRAEDDGNDANVTREADVTADFPMPPAPERTQTVPAGAMPSTEPSAPSKPPRKRGPLATLSVALLILLLIAIGAAGVLLANGKLPLFNAAPTVTTAPTATLAPTATPQIALTMFTDADNVFHIGYPTGWLTRINNDPGTTPRLAIFANPPTQASFNVGTLSTTDIPAQGIVEQELSVLAQKTGIAHRSGPATVFMAGETWTQEAGDVTVLQNGKATPMHAVALATIHNSHTIYILELAPVDTFTTIDPVFQQMLQSFEFLS